MINRTIAAPVIALGTLLAVAAGCGGDGPSTAATTSPSAAASHPAPTSAHQTSKAGDDFCQHTTGINPAALLGAGPDKADQMKSDLESAVGDVPDDLKPDLQTVADIEGPFLDGSVDQAQLQHALSDPRFSTALEHISAWATTHCG